MMYGEGGCTNCEGDCDTECGCSSCPTHRCNSKKKYISDTSKGSVKIPVKPPGSNYVMQIINCGVRSNNLYETKLLLAPEIDMSSVKITVKNDNLRVTADRPLGDLGNQLPGIVEKSALGDLVRRTIKHCENFLIPEEIDAGKVRAVMNNDRILILTAPPQKAPQKEKKLRKYNKC